MSRPTFANNKQKGLSVSKMTRQNVIKVKGVILEALPNAQFLVEIEEPKIQIRAYLAGKMIQNKIKVIVGDRVDLEVPPSTHLQNAIARIVFRTK